MTTPRRPAGASDAEILMLANILPTSCDVGVLDGRVRPGDVVAIIGAGPVGLAAIMAARSFSPSRIVAIDVFDGRLDVATCFGADLVVNHGHDDAFVAVMELTGGLGADVAIEAVGIPATFELATMLIRSGGHVADIGVHGKRIMRHLEELWSRDTTTTTGLVDASSAPTRSGLTTGAQRHGTRWSRRGDTVRPWIPETWPWRAT